MHHMIKQEEKQKIVAIIALNTEIERIVVHEDVLCHEITAIIARIENGK